MIYDIPSLNIMLQPGTTYSRVTRTIGFKLFLVFGIVQVVFFTLLTYNSIRVLESNLMQNVLGTATRLSDMIVRSTRYSMLLNRKDDVHEIIQSVGGQEGIRGIRVYNKQGEIIFSTVPAEIKTKVDINAEACVTCHQSRRLDRPELTSDALTRIFTPQSGDRVLALITPIYNQPECANASCHAHPGTKTILGVLDVKMSLSAVDAQIASTRDELVLLSIIVILSIGACSAIFIWFVVRRPVKKLIAGMESVSTGHLDERLAIPSHDEIGQLAEAFNNMTEDLQRAHAEITAWSHTLEAKVKEKTAALEKAHRQIVMVEKMASLGNLASSVAHELNNPLEGILTFARLLIKRIKKTTLPPEVVLTYTEDLKLMADEAQRCGNIVKNLLLFARHGSMSFQTVLLSTIAERCILLVNHHAQMHKVVLESKIIGGDDEVECDPNQIQQVMIGIMINAIEAISGVGLADGKVCIEIERQGAEMAIRIVDNGPGMTDEVKAHVFEPFFTTKSEGKGVGLGLAIAYGIIERHRGSIEVESATGKGTTFVITIPVRHTALGQAPAPAATT
jgi:two-component system NtrC family sensor kinase